MSFMINIEKKELNMSIELKIKMICRFNNLQYEFINGNIKNINNPTFIIVID